MSVFSQMVSWSGKSQNSEKKTLKEQLILCFAWKVSSVYSFSVDSATVSMDIFYIKDSPKSELQKFGKEWD